jgi:endoglucanase
MRLIAASLLACMLAPTVLETANAATHCASWTAWQRFKQHQLSADGRVVDHDTPQLKTVSEGQAYALFFSLIAGDRASFDRILQWTQNNLSAGDLAASLPAWSWGRRDDGSFGILDANAAADADLWIAYSLLEASRLWRAPHYRDLGLSVAQRVQREEVAEIPGLGPTLLPGPKGFVHDDGWRLNPSYLPLQILRGLQRSNGEKIWGQVAQSAEKVIVGASPQGYAPDWILFRAGKFLADPATHGEGSYDAIRVYLWTGMLSIADPARAALLAALRPMAAATASRGAPPEVIDTRSSQLHGNGPVGFSAALLPFLASAALADAAHVQRLRARAWQDNVAHRAYYDEALMLFGLGWQERRYRFDANGSLLLTSMARDCVYSD